MSAPAAADASVGLERLERGTRVAFQALGWLLLLGAGLPEVLRSGDTWWLRWFWQPAPQGFALAYYPISGGQLLAVGLAALLLSTGRPVSRRGRRVLLAWGLAQAWLALSGWSPAAGPTALFAFRTPTADALTGGLGLMLLLTQADPRAGARLCRLGGIYALGAALLPLGPDLTPMVSLAWHAGGMEGPGVLMVLLYLGWGALLLVLGFARRGRRALGGLALVCLALSAVCGFLIQVEVRTSEAGDSVLDLVDGMPTLESTRAVLLQLAQPALGAVAAFAWWAGWRVESRAGRPGLTAAFRA